ncbi:probable indole-3-pyruvate monooxygenase YUCCA10 [Zingiber officinale]|uniref:Flavin-containing monooxygenase n=1 Tax=Zingiber officinale TaxID=94328 RepID=A0A8J5M636_ZINOF|nr:probable indole-3-pyruvate monooxygenase YUCCA10 [Zingiber officinale]KAG6533938.1 hypothetical protein ZIOFF_007817 [Zingiber officinale]
MREEVVLIVGAGQSGLATAACLTELSVPCLILERDGCIASLWRQRCYDRVKLHLAKEYSHLPHSAHPPEAPTFLPKNDFVRYLDDYAERFRLRVALSREVVSAEYHEASGRWLVTARNTEENGSGAEELYAARYLVVASGENADPAMPEIPGLAEFRGSVVHSSRYRTGRDYEGKAVLVVGGGNSGMEIALDLANGGVHTTCVVVRSQLHIVPRGIWFVAMRLMKYLPMWLVDHLILLACYFIYGNLAKYGLHRPPIGPMYMKKHTPIYPVVDVGTVSKIKSGAVQVVPSIKSIDGHNVTFTDGKIQNFDAVILATGYRSSVKKWLKGDDFLIGEDGMSKQKYPNHWKGKNKLYCAGLVRMGILGSGEDAQKIAKDIAGDYRNI